MINLHPAIVGRRSTPQGSELQLVSMDDCTEMSTPFRITITGVGASILRGVGVSMVFDIRKGASSAIEFLDFKDEEASRIANMFNRPFMA